MGICVESWCYGGANVCCCLCILLVSSVFESQSAVKINNGQSNLAIGGITTRWGSDPQIYLCCGATGLLLLVRLTLAYLLTVKQRIAIIRRGAKNGCADIEVFIRPIVKVLLQWFIVAY